MAPAQPHTTMLASLGALAYLGAAAAASGGGVAVMTTLCGAQDAKAAMPLLSSLLFHRSSAVTLHFLADAQARRALKKRFRASAHRAVVAHLIHAEKHTQLVTDLLPFAADSTCAALPLFAAELLPEESRLVVLSPTAVLQTDIAELWGQFASFTPQHIFGAAQAQQIGATGLSADVLLMDLQRMRGREFVALLQSRADATAEGSTSPLAEILSSMGADVTYSLPCRWNVQLVQGGLCSMPGSGCDCYPPKVLVDTGDASGQTHGLRKMYDFWKKPPPSLNTYLFEPKMAQAIGITSAADTAEDDDECAPGWTGDDCSECADGYSGDACEKINGDAAERDKCPPGWAGKKCDQCAPGYSGPKCDKPLKRLAEAAANEEGDDDECMPGFGGPDCDTCLPGHGGDLCKPLANTASKAKPPPPPPPPSPPPSPASDEDDSECSEGWAGEDCDQCAEGYSGDMCTKVAAAAVAEEEDDECMPGFGGPDCDTCLPGHGGDLCKPLVVEEESECSEGWAGEDCDQCAEGYSGDMCTKVAAAAVAEEEDDECMPGFGGPDCDTCLPGHGGDLCKPLVVEEESECSEGWAGEDCDQCAEGYSGDMCTKV
eukprot:SAG25_NODE_414_length_8276_cov_29.934939_1_plen_600_part_10